MAARKRDILRDIHVVLPPCSTDYSGASSALYELGGLVIIHGPHGCGGNAVNRDEPRCAGMPARVFSSNLTDMDATMGRDEVLIQEAVRTWQLVGGEFVALVGTPATMVNGTDYDAVAREIGRRCGVPAFGIDSSGTFDYVSGASKALVAVAKMLVGEGERGSAEEDTPRPRTVNLLGATPLDIACQDYVDAAKAELEQRGWRVVSCWSMGSGLDDLRRGLDVGANVVLTASGLPLARWMKENLGIPYVWGTLSSSGCTDACAELLEQVVAGRTDAVLPARAGNASTNAPGTGTAPADCRDNGAVSRTHEEGGTPKRALVVADQVLAESMRRALEREGGFSQVVVATLTSGGYPELARPDDIPEASELELMRLVNGSGFDIVVGDGLLASLVRDPKACTCGFVPVPSVGVSARFIRPGAVCPYGPAFLAGVSSPRPASTSWYPSSLAMLERA
jgi:nitrogenase molybdenum-cofactor synthesis protein NifE